MGARKNARKNDLPGSRPRTTPSAAGMPRMQAPIATDSARATDSPSEW
jgi:hypothetical protein